MDIDNQVECKNVKAGENLFTSAINDNILIFVSAGNILIHTDKGAPITEVGEGFFILLPQGTKHKAKATIATRLLMIHAGPLSRMIVDDPEWNTEKPAVLPILPDLAKTLRQIEYYSNEKRLNLN